jgi:hypothetical protein
MNLLYHEMNRLINDYYKCDSHVIKELIYNDIKLLNNALFLSNLPYYFINDLKLEKEPEQLLCPNFQLSKYFPPASS